MTNTEAPVPPSRSRYYVKRSRGGAKLLAFIDGRFVTARRFKAIYLQIIEDLGSDVNLSEGQKQLARRVAQLCAACEQMEAQAASGEVPLDLDAYRTATDSVCRTMRALGLSRHMRDVSSVDRDIASIMGRVSAEDDDG